MRKPLTPEQMRARKCKRAKIIGNTVCPVCAANIGERCSGSRGQRRTSPHLERTRAYKAESCNASRLQQAP